MKIAFGMIVCNGDDFLDECLSQAYDIADQIVIAEGATESWMRAAGWSSPESKDRTLEILKRWEAKDTQGKISVVHGRWSNKTEQSNGYMRLIHDDIDYVWQLDSDEFYMKDDMLKVRKWLETEKPTYVLVKLFHFFKNYHTIGRGGEGWGWDQPAPRIQRFYKDARYSEHRPPSITNPATGSKNENIRPANMTTSLGVYCYHYTYVTNKQVCEKMRYYMSEFPGTPRLQSWIKNVWEVWDKDPLGVEQQHGTHPSAWRGSRTEKFLGEHPESMRSRIQ